ncbi:nucleic acid-binding protein [Rhizopus microsporus var. microsporus]|uniref:Nucleic acid-binding protein n=1 Tax=Rhizopus microsporus var. microsporus TaxID=86635 RepID=A0A1X0RCN2_RHIZD|nr:nucleic acid-binding protein [Rhizopus microsporus var. microsporus]
MAKRKNSTSAEATPTKTAVDATAVTISSNAEESFPRGGASALTPLEHREIANQAAKDLFESTTKNADSAFTDSEPAKKKRKPNKKTKATAKPAEKPKSDKAYIEQLTFKKLTVGTCLLGCVSRINELELFVSLPHQLVGVIPITEISDALTETIQKIANDEDEDMDEEENKMPSLNNMFYVGQWLRCKITNLPALEEKAKRPIELSLKPQVVNEDLLKVDTTPGVTLGATVKSVEDHGYVLDLGVKDLTGFLPTKEAKTYIEKYNRNEELSVGQYVECLVEKTNKRIANVTIDRSKIANSAIENPFSRITSVLPGQQVSGMIETVQNNGLVLKMMGLYKVTIDATHIPANMDIETSFKLGQKLVFRTLFTILNTEEKAIGGSILPHVLELDVPTLANGTKSDKFVGDVFPAGSFLDNTKVYRVSNGGIWVTLDSLDGITGFVHISRLADERVPNLSATAGDYKIGSTHRARVLSYNPVDAILVLTLQPSVLAEKYLRVTDIEIGSMVEGVVEKLVPAGVIVKISKSINALVPAVHMADVKLSHPEYKFKSGKKVECRVLKIDPERQRVILTLKKSLINSEYPIFQNLADIHESDISHGVIMAIKRNGCVVAYYNNISAFVPGSEMTEAHVADLSTVYNVGQTVKTTVLRVDPSANKLIVSCIAHKKKKEKQVTKKEKKDKKEKTEKSEKKPVKKTVKKDNHLRTVAKKNGLKKFSDVRRGVCYQGYITNITDAGVFLKLSKTISARVKIGNLSDEFVENWKSLYKIGDCVQLKIIHIDREQERLEASLKKSVIERKDESKQEGQTAEDSDSDEEMPEVDEGEDEDEEMKDNKEEVDDDSDDEEEEKPEVDDDNEEEDDE